MCMSTQIAVRLPDGLVDQIDELIEAGGEKSRASIIERALARELRRLQIEEDVAKLEAESEATPGSKLSGLDHLARWAARASLDVE